MGIPSGKVAVGFCYAQSTVTPQWRSSYTMVLVRDATKARRVVGEFAHETSGAHLASARCDIVREFLAHPDRPDWLWLIDTDATFAPDALDRLLSSADPVDRPIVGALAFGVRPGRDAQGRDIRNGVGATPLELFPTIYIYGENGAGIVADYPLDQLVQCNATGAHCLLIHRNVLADPRWLEDGHPQPWFRMGFRQSGEVSEDQFFCMKAGALGFPIFVDTAVKTGHVKTFVADEDLYLAQRGGTVSAPPATEETAVIVPVLNRPQNAAPFMRSIRASTGLAHVYAVADPDDPETAAAWKDAGATVIESTGSSFAVKVNQGFRETSEPWIFICGDDVSFHPDWLDHAQLAGERGDVVGTNDLINPRVIAGEHATHMLIRRSYIAEQGASWDGPGIVCHEGYGHWFVDDEIVTTAKQRDTFIPALSSVVEHHHPITGRVPMDATYERGQATAEQDRHLFKRRLAQHRKVAA